ncbi:MAG: MarR family transcriptional regulator [Gaiellales bacterium]|nr:MarR family transcriptional regulator [Gaiellales bacterium]
MMHEPDMPPRRLEGLDPLSAGVFLAFRRAFVLQRRLVSKAFAERGIHPSEAMCVRVLADRNGISQRDLADSLHLSRPRVTAILQALERSGAVARQPDYDDQRLTRVFLTQHGRVLSGELQGVFASCLGTTIGSLSEEDRRELIRLLEIMADSTKGSLHETEAGEPERHDTAAKAPTP